MNWLDGHIWRVVVSSLISRWRSMTSDVLHGFLLEQVLFDILIDDIDSGFLRVPSVISQSTPSWMVQLTLQKCKHREVQQGPVHLDWSNPRHDYRVDWKQICRRTWGFWWISVDDKLSMSHQCSLAVQKANWSASKEERPEGCGWWLCPCVLPSWGPTRSTAFSSGVHMIRRAGTC